MLRPSYPIATERLLLRPFEPGDLDALAAIQDRDDVVRFLYWERRDRAGLEDLLAAVRRDSGELIGDVTLLWLSKRQLGLHRIIGRLDGRNTASARVLERLGMRREARLVENEFVKGEWTDEVIYALLEREWASEGPETPSKRSA